MTKKNMDVAQFNTKRFSEEKEFHPMAPAPESVLLDGITLTVVSSAVGDAHQISKRITGEYANYNMAGHRTGSVDIAALDRIEKLEIELSCSVLISFDGIQEDGKTVECNDTNKRRLMTEHKWLRNQVIQKADDEAFFYKSEQSNF